MSSGTKSNPTSVVLILQLNWKGVKLVIVNVRFRQELRTLSVLEPDIAFLFPLRQPHQSCLTLLFEFRACPSRQAAPERFRASGTGKATQRAGKNRTPQRRLGASVNSRSMPLFLRKRRSQGVRFFSF